MKKLTYALFIVVALLAIARCSPEHDLSNEYDTQALYTCHEQQDWTLGTVQQALAGQWEWKFARTWSSGDRPAKTSMLYIGAKIRFVIDGTGVYTKPNASPLNFTWRISDTNGLNGEHVYGVRTEPDVLLVSGFVFLCDNRMVCSAIPVDGADNYFKRVN